MTDSPKYHEPTPTATLTYPLPMYGSEFRIAANAGRYVSVLWDLDQEMRATGKYDALPMIQPRGGVELTYDENKENEIIARISGYWRDRLWRLLDDQNVRLDDE